MRVAVLARHTWATAQHTPHLIAHLEWWRASYHFVRPHQSLRVALIFGLLNDLLLSPASFRRKVSRCFNHIDTRGVALRQLTEVRLKGAPAREVLLCPLPPVST